MAKKKSTEADGSATMTADAPTPASTAPVIPSIEKATAAAEKDLEKADSAQAVETKLRVMRTVKLDGKDEDSTGTDETIEVTPFLTVPAMATVTVPVKISRSYQSIGVEVSVSLPCYKEEIKEGIEEAYNLAKLRVFKEIDVIQKALNNLVAASHGQQPPV